MLFLCYKSAMTKTVHRSMYFPLPQYQFLQAEAERFGITVTALIIRIIDAYRNNR